MWLSGLPWPHCPDSCPQNLNNETNVLKGITTLRFRISDRVLANSTLNPMNWAYWMNGPSGVINITNCAPNNVPIFLSLPHFYRASPSVPALVTGMQPDPTLHDLWLDVEPNTGATMSAHKRLQINVHLKPIHPFLDPSKAWFNNVNASLLCPSLWLDVQGQISDDLVSQSAVTCACARSSVSCLRALLSLLCLSCCVARAGEQVQVVRLHGPMFVLELVGFALS